MVPGSFLKCVRELKMSMGTMGDGAHAGDGQDAIQHAAQAAAEYRRALMKVRGWCSMLGFFGALAIYQAIHLMEAGIDIAVVGFAVGGFLIVTAITAAIWPSPRTIALEAIAFLAIAAWDITLVVLTGGEAIELAVWAAIEIGIAIYLLAVMIPRFSRMADTKPSAETLKQLADIAKSIRKAKVKKEPDIFEFKKFRETWRLRLDEQVATAVETQKGADMFFVSPDELDVVDHTKPGKDSKKRKVTVHAGDKTWKAKLSRSDFQRLMQWKGDEQQEPPAGSPTSPQQPEQL